jgi:hydroxymethylglutaryl-CoA lyase
VSAREVLHITDVALRDGLQNQPMQVTTQDKLRLMQLLALAGVHNQEATSFVSPRAVPQMADAGELLAQLAATEWGHALRVSALVPNLKGLERASAAGVKEVAVVLSATQTMNLKNINMDLATARHTCEQTLAHAQSLGLRTRAYVAVAFECPYEGITPVERVVDLVRSMDRAGAHEIVIADTIGAAAPAQVTRVLKALADVLPVERLAMHFHDTRGMGVANAWAAIEGGVRRLDASAGGIGGCPFAPGAAGNLATEDLVVLAHQSGLDTGIDPARLLQAIDFAQGVLQHPVGGRSAGWLRRVHRLAVQA